MRCHKVQEILSKKFGGNKNGLGVEKKGNIYKLRENAIKITNKTI